MLDFTKISELKLDKVIDKIEDINGLVIYEAWRELIKNGVPPLILTKCKQDNLLDYKMYGNSVQDRENLIDEKTICANLTEVEDGVYTGTLAQICTNEATRVRFSLKDYIGQRVVFSLNGKVSDDVLRPYAKINNVTTSGKDIKTKETYSISSVICTPKTESDYIGIDYGEGANSVGYIKDLRLVVSVSPQTPVEVESVGDKTKNLFNLSKIVVGEKTTDRAYISEVFENGFKIQTPDNYTGNGYVNTFVKFKDLFPDAKAGRTYTLRMTGTKPIEMYEEAIYLPSISVWYSGYSKEITEAILEETVVFYGKRNPNETNTITNIMLVEGTEVIDYEPYGYRIPIKARGKNLVNIPYISKDTVAPNGQIDINCYLTKPFIISCQEYPSLIANDSGVEANIWRLSIKYLDGTLQYAMDSALKRENGYPLPKFNASEENPVISISYRGNFIREGKYDGFLVEYGDTITDYESYVEPITTNLYLNEPLRKMEDYADYIDFNNKKVVRNISKMLLKELDWEQHVSNKNIYKCNLYGRAGFNPLSNIFDGTGYHPSVSIGDMKEDYCIKKHITANSLYVSDSIDTTIETFKAILGDNYIVYILSTPTEETIELPNIPTIKGTTILEVDTDVTPSNMEVTYKGKGE